MARLFNSDGTDEFNLLTHSDFYFIIFLFKRINRLYLTSNPITGFGNGIPIYVVNKTVGYWVIQKVFTTTDNTLTDNNYFQESKYYGK